MEVVSNFIDKLMKKRKPDFQANYPLLAARLIEEITRPGVARTEEITKIARDFLRDPSGLSQEERHLTAYLILSFFPNQVPVEINQTLTQIVQKAQASDPLMQQLTTSVETMREEVAGYFRYSAHTCDYFLPAPLSNQLAKAVLSLEIHRVALAYRDQFEQEKPRKKIIQGFVNQVGSPGVWMSNQGIKFDPKKL